MRTEVDHILIENIKPFNLNEISTDCYIPCILNCLDYINSDYVYKFLEYISFNYVFSTRKGIRSQELILGVDSEEFEIATEKLLFAHNIHVVRNRNEVRYLDEIKDCINKKIPVIAFVDQYFDSNSIEYMTERNAYHSLVIIGYDDDNKMITYYDYWLNKNYGKRTLSYDLFCNGMESYLEGNLAAFNIKFMFCKEAGPVVNFTINNHPAKNQDLLGKLKNYYLSDGNNIDFLIKYVNILDMIINKNTDINNVFCREFFKAFGIDAVAYKQIDRYILEKTPGAVTKSIYILHCRICEKYKVFYNVLLKARFSSRKRDEEKVAIIFKEIVKLEIMFCYEVQKLIENDYSISEEA